MTQPHNVEREAQSNLPFLSDELIVEILLWLPVRSLLRFKSVCKSWKTLISSPQFAKDNLQRSIANPATDPPQNAYLVHHWINHRLVVNIALFSLQSLFENPISLKPNCSEIEPKFIRVIGSCNGLLCLCSAAPNCVRLWNPCTNQFSSKWVDHAGFGITCHGFGHDHVYDKYKLFMVVRRIPLVITSKVYTFGEDSWTTIQNFPFPPDHRIGQFVSGTLNWLARVPNTANPNQRVIVFLDLGNLTYGQLSLPSSGEDDENLCNPTLLVLRGCLCVCFDHNETHWALWMMKEYRVEQSWIKLAMISHLNLNLPPTVYPLEPLYIFENDDVLAISHVLPYKLVSLNSNDGMLNYLQIKDSDFLYSLPSIRDIYSFRGYGLHIHHESLVSPP